MPKKPPIGKSDFKKVIRDDHYYIDKTLFIQEVLEQSSAVLLIPRPRRFGKTMNLSMLHYFLEKTEESSASLFEGLAIYEKKEAMKHYGQYPVVFLTFKDAKRDTFEECFEHIQQLLAEEYRRHKSILTSGQLDQEEIQYYESILKQEASKTETNRALFQLTRFLFRVYEKHVFVLVDEYDTPVHAGYAEGYLKTILSFMRNLLGAALKDNKYLEKGVVTGAMRIAREAIFTGLNNLDVFTLLYSGFSDKFGFTEPEVQKILEDFQLEKYSREVREQYNGYLFGDQVIYNPWSIVKFINKPEDGLLPHWIHTSGNDLIRDWIVQGRPSIHKGVETLFNGGTISTSLNENIVLRDLDKSPQEIWSFMVFCGYLKPVSREWKEEQYIYELAIPNGEVRFFFRNTVLSWLRKRIEQERLEAVLNALVSGKIEEFSRLFQSLVSAILSYHDMGEEEPERVYHAFVLGLLAFLSDRFYLRSNRESGFGRYDVMLLPKNSTDFGIIIEFKKSKAENSDAVDRALEKALTQILKKDYVTELREQKVERILGIAVAVKGKKVWVKGEFLDPKQVNQAEFDLPEKTSSHSEEKGFDFKGEFTMLLDEFFPFKENLIKQQPALKEELDKIDDQLAEINPDARKKKEIPLSSLNRLGRILRKEKLPSPQLRKSYNKIARWLKLTEAPG